MEKITFLKRIKISLIGLEEYIKFLGERFSKCVFYVFIMSIILSIIFSIVSISYIFLQYNSIENYIEERVPEFSVIEGKIVVDEEEKELDDKKNSVLVINQMNESMDFNFAEDGYNKKDLINDVSENLKSIIISCFIGIMLANFIEVTIFWFVNSILTSIIRTNCITIL
ncbi:MAG: DUF1189 family protein [Clostridia bacterium]|nr:DUF1189 family protein [Clostridia bacterium]